MVYMCQKGSYNHTCKCQDPDCEHIPKESIARECNVEECIDQGCDHPKMLLWNMHDLNSLLGYEICSEEDINNLLKKVFAEYVKDENSDNIDLHWLLAITEIMQNFKRNEDNYDKKVVFNENKHDIFLKLWYY
uniref:Uncharacterized protein n=1 Tax=Marseillevirus LCMAC201 TaxID=2506605 RepID=A0A481YVW0_9VIRU|nr:MAG: hypothetical protein LCMAC201_02480 [Marseillevirus LCMAC201]